MRALGALLFFSATSLLTGCTSVDLSPAETREMTAKLLGIAPSSIVVQTPARFAVTGPGQPYAEFTSGVYTQTRSEIELLQYDSKTKALSKGRSIDLREVKLLLILSTGLASHIQQLQLTVADKIVALDCTNDPNADGGYRGETKPVIDGLIEAGVAHEQVASLIRPDAWIIPSELRNWSPPIPVIKK